MKKDIRSFKRHNAQYEDESNNYEHTLEKIALYDSIDQFKLLGFEQAIRLMSSRPKIHIDIGSGNGWLVRKTSSFFEKAIGIEPSAAIVEVARKVNQNIPNISFINSDMVDGLEAATGKDPVFLTTATVLNHIEDDSVKVFLHKVNDLPEGSYLYFDERYDKNVLIPLWYVRSKDWWIKNLPNWQLYFCNYDMAGYASGIFGIRLSYGDRLPSRESSLMAKIFWHASLPFTFIERVLQKFSMIKRFLSKTITYIRNKIYNSLAHIQIAWYSSKKIKNYEAYKAAKKSKVKNFVVEFEGYKLYCDAGYTTEVYAFLEPCVTEDYTRKLNYKIKPGAIVFDIGAHVGSFSVYAASHGAKVYAFEPDPLNYQKLLENITLNGFEKKIIAFNHAITDKQGTMKLASMEGNTGGHSLYLDTGEYIVVDTYSFEESMQKAGVEHIDLIKIDTEGAEYTILPNIKPETYKRIGAIIGEYHLLPELPGKHYNYLKRLLSPYFKDISHHIPYYFKALK
jgi:FkbM family methyltransferase